MINRNNTGAKRIDCKSNELVTTERPIAAKIKGTIVLMICHKAIRSSLAI
jgi:hypothetical protein